MSSTGIPAAAPPPAAAAGAAAPAPGAVAAPAPGAAAPPPVAPPPPPAPLKAPQSLGGGGGGGISFAAQLEKRTAELEDTANDINHVHFVKDPNFVPPPTVKCPRCELDILEVEMDSHKQSHSSEILPFLFLGGERNANNRKEIFVRTKVTHVLNMAWEAGTPFADDGINYKCLQISDHAYEDILSLFDEGADFIEEARSNDGNVLVHCVQGISRSCAMTMAYLMKYKGMKRDEAMHFVKTRRPIVRPNDGFLKQLAEYEAKITSS